MDHKERPKRPVLDRDQPSRGWNGLFGSHDEPDRVGDKPKQPPGAEEVRSASYEAVNSAYRVVDEYLRQGQRLAEQVWLPTGTTATAPVTNFARIVERFMRSAGDMGTAWLEMMGQWVGEQGESTRGPLGVARPFSAGKVAAESSVVTSGAQTSSPSQALTVAVDASRTFEVCVELHGSAGAESIQIRELVSTDGSSPPLSDMQIEPNSQGRGVTLRISVPDGQPAGVYNGLLIDRSTHRACGTVSLLLK
jgi:hypothetical protein